MRIFGLIHSFSAVFWLLKKPIFRGQKMPFFAQISKVQYFISTIKPSFQHFINIFNKARFSQSTFHISVCKKIFTLQNFTKFYLSRLPNPLTFNILRFSVPPRKPNYVF